MYRSLDPSRIEDTSNLLRLRIEERFKESGLSRVAHELQILVAEAAQSNNWLRRPNLWLRSAVFFCISLMGLALAGMVSRLDLQMESIQLLDFLSAVEAAVNDLIFLGIGIFFLISWESRIKRKKVLRAIHELRSMAHIIDMHQLTKDPEKIKPHAVHTPSSPRRVMTPYELTRYLDYCSEMLALISKVGALYIQNFDDPATLRAVDELENLTTGLSRKIWQKIMILDRIMSLP
ncbi:MAG TPA: hypothetical protein PK014_01360 [Thermoanaerobaculia bacterium]|nr:hypothetical protein [Thermoanaerobaculia bacterium]HUM28658.1 hypothetical protein [Thermoanaerobaculia bacterium]HXK66734.1 hypothetical protein [Thermoanaerobaculia bacterium]